MSADTPGARAVFIAVIGALVRQAIVLWPDAVDEVAEAVGDALGGDAPAVSLQEAQA